MSLRDKITDWMFIVFMGVAILFIAIVAITFMAVLFNSLFNKCY